jgi:exopolyphosphatase / guanosine-5'-triphosphate,3'-diphosphate pyrophosphatase
VRIGILDLGTNMFNLLIVEATVGESNFKKLHGNKIGVKLGENGINDKIINSKAFSRGLFAIDTHISTIQNFHCDRIIAFATSAIRNATNGGEFVAKVKEMYNISIRVIDGDKEAEFIYHGVKLANALKDNETSLIMDIGGGSTEFIICNNNEIFWKKSYELGVSRLFDKFNLSNPITDIEIENISQYLIEETTELSQAIKNYKIDTLVGSSGSFDTLAEIICKKKNPQIKSEEISNYDFDKMELEELHQILLKSNLDERIKMQGMIAIRADFIVISSIFIQMVLKQYDINKIHQSSYSLKEGVLFAIMNKSLLIN